MTLRNQSQASEKQFKVDLMNNYAIPTIAKLKKPKLSPLLPEQNQKCPYLSKEGITPVLGSKFGQIPTSQKFTWRKQSIKPSTKPFDAADLDVPAERKIIHRQQILIAKKAVFDIELSWENSKFFIVVRRKFSKHLRDQLASFTLNDKDDYKAAIFAKTLWLR